MIEQLLVITLIGTVLSIDVTLAGQFLLSRPLVVLTIIGFYAGNPAAGFVLGVLLELLCSDMLPLGGSVPLDTAVMSAVAASSYFLGESYEGLNIRSVPLLMALISGIKFRGYDLWFKKKASGVFFYLQEISKYLDKTIELAIAVNIFLTIIRNFIFMIIFSALAVFIKNMFYLNAHQSLIRSFIYFDGMLPYLAVAVILSAVKHKRYVV